MDMKKILQALDGASSKPVAGANDMKKFLSVVTEGKDTKTNRLTTAEQIAVQHYTEPEAKVTTNPVLNKPKNEHLIKKYVDMVLAERAEELEAQKSAIRERAARVVKSMKEGAKVTKVDPAAKTVTYSDDSTHVTTTVPQTMVRPGEGNKLAVDKNAAAPGGADQQGSEIQPGMDVEISELSPELLGRAAKLRHQEKIKNIASTMFQDPKDPEIAKIHHKMAQREKGAERTRTRFDKHRADSTAKAHADRNQQLRDKYAGVNIDAEIERLQPALKSAYNDYQYGARNTWSQGKDKYDQLSAKIRELEQAKKLLNDIGEGDER